MIAGRLARTILTIIACLSLTARHARADEPAAPASRCVPPESVTVQVAPFADKRVAERVAREIASVLETMPSAPCWRAHDPPRGPTIHIEVRWPDAARARVVIVATTSRRVHYGIRELDLQKLPRDGIPLAVAVATDELLATIGEQLGQDLPPSPAPSVSPSVEAPRSTPASAPSPQRFAFGPAAALDFVGPRLTLVGPDAQLLVPLTSSFALALRFGTRAALEPKRDASLRTSGGWLAGGTLRIGPSGPRAGFAVSAGVDAMTLKSIGPNESFVDTLAVGRVGLTAFTAITPSLRLTADAYVGGAIGRIHGMTDGDRGRSAGEGIAAGGTLGVAALF